MLAIGIAQQAGCVLVTDSLVQLQSPRGTRAQLCMTPRFEPIPGAGGAAIVAAMHAAGWTPDPTAFGIEAAAQELIDDLRANLSSTPWRFADGEEVESRGEILAAGLDATGRIRLVQWLTNGEPTWADGPAVFIGGAARDLGLEVEAPPSSLDRCVDYGLALARAAIDRAAEEGGYRDLADALDRVGVPSMAPPFHVAVVTAGGVRMGRYAK